MNNEIGRKLTSLTLMTIMLAGGMTIAAPSMMVPEAAAAGKLYVSAENAMFDNTFGGAQIVEIVVFSGQNETDEEQAEPVVKIDENLIRLAQGTDGNWYAYFGDSTAVAAADTASNNLDFGIDGVPLQLGANDAAFESANIYMNATDGVISNPPELSNQNRTVSDQSIAKGTSTAAQLKTATHLIGQIGLLDSAEGATNGQIQDQWPMIQLYDLTIENFDVVYEQAGPDEVVSLNFDSGDLDDYASLTLDRNAASQGSDVHLVITDNQLNIDPTAEDIVIFYTNSDGRGANGEGVSFTDGTNIAAANYLAYDNDFDDNGKLLINNQTNGENILSFDTTLDDTVADGYLVFYEGGENSGIFYNTDDDDDANLDVNEYAKRGFTATFDYNDSAQSFVVANDFGVIDMDEASVGDAWNSGEALTVTLIDQDLNKNSGSDEDLLIANTTRTHLVPSLQIGSPLMLTTNTTAAPATIVAVTDFSNIAYVDIGSGHFGTGGNGNNMTVPTGWTGTQVAATNNGDQETSYLNYDVSFFTNSTNDMSGICLVESSGRSIACDADADGSSIVQIKGTEGTTTSIMNVTASFSEAHGGDAVVSAPIALDIFSFGPGINNAIYRILLEETDDNSATFVGSIEYEMLNQINIDKPATYTALSTIDQDVDIIIEQDMTDEDSPRVNYLDLGADGVSTQIADQVEAPTHDGVVSFDLENYKIADTVVVTLDDQDMNSDSELIDVYTTQATGDVVGEGTTVATGLVLDITFDDEGWVDYTEGSCSAAATGDDGLHATGFTLVETDVASGIFTGSFQVPTSYCSQATDTVVTVTGTDIEVNYQDFRNASGESIEVGDGASINANTGSVAFDRTVYPVPYGSDAADTRFAEHATANYSRDLAQGDVTVHVRVTDADYNISAQGEDVIKDTTVVLKIERGSNSTTVATIGDSVANQIVEVSPDSGVFEYDQAITYTDGPTNSCPSVFDGKSAGNGCVLQGDIITVTYTDNYDASGKSQTVTDSATFDLRNGVLQSDKSVYLIGSDMILTLIEPDFDLDNDAANSAPLNLIEWDSDAATTTLNGNESGGDSTANAAAFDPEPSELRETGDSTGIFQVVIEIPETLSSEKLDRGEMVELEYTDWGPAGADYVGQ